MRVLHIFDHSSPWPTGYALRSRALGFKTFQVASARHRGLEVLAEEVEGWRLLIGASQAHGGMPLLLEALPTRLADQRPLLSAHFQSLLAGKY